MSLKFIKNYAFLISCLTRDVIKNLIDIELELFSMNSFNKFMFNITYNLITGKKKQCFETKDDN